MLSELSRNTLQKYLRKRDPNHTIRRGLSDPPKNIKKGVNRAVTRLDGWTGKGTSYRTEARLSQRELEEIAIRLFSLNEKELKLLDKLSDINEISDDLASRYRKARKQDYAKAYKRWTRRSDAGKVKPATGETLARAVAKSGPNIGREQGAMNADPDGGRVVRRRKGLDLVDRRDWRKKRAVKEETDLTELSRDTLRSYVGKAAQSQRDIDKRVNAVARTYGMSSKKFDGLMDKWGRRNAGLGRARRRLGEGTLNRGHMLNYFKSLKHGSFLEPSAFRVAPEPASTE